MFSRKIVISGNGAIEIRRNLVESVVERLVSIASGMFGKDFSLFNDVTRISRRESWRNGLFVEWKRPALFRLLGMVFSSNGNGLPFFAFWEWSFRRMETACPFSPFGTGRPIRREPLL